MLNDTGPTQLARRQIFKKTIAMSAATAAATAGISLPTITFAASLSKDERDEMTPADVIERFKQGNLRFRQSKPLQHDFLAQMRKSASGQFPAAVVLSCIDSRAPAEIIMDAGIGETFNTRVAGNVGNADVLGSMEFACAVAGAKLVLVLGHTSCGAVKGAIGNAELGNLTGLLDKIRPAIAQTSYSGDRSADNYDFVDAVARKNVEMTVQGIREKSLVLKNLEAENKIRIVGGMYYLAGGQVEFFDV